jgi:hypothetical protein
MACFVSSGEFAPNRGVRVCLRINEPLEVLTARHQWQAAAGVLGFRPPVPLTNEDTAIGRVWRPLMTHRGRILKLLLGVAFFLFFALVVVFL